MNKNNKIVITTGGTGGHIYPALSLAKELASFPPFLEVTFIGGGLEENAYFDKQAFPYHTVDYGALSLRGIFKILKGTWQSLKLLYAIKPDVVVGFGSYYTLPTLLAAFILRRKIALHEANSVPGKVNRRFSRVAKITGVQFPPAKKMLKGVCLEADLPLREGYKDTRVDPALARAHFGLEQEGWVWLVFGGSQGSKAIYAALKEVLETGSFKNLQFLMITGDEEEKENWEAFFKKQGILACVKVFEERMDLAWQAADACLCRAGAGTIAEALAFSVPMLLIPYPQASDDHQTKNAEFISEQVKGGEFLLQKPEELKKLKETMETVQQEHKLLKKNLIEYQESIPNREFARLIRGLL